MGLSIGLSIGLWIFIGLILMLIAEFAPPPPKGSQNTKIQKPKIQKPKRSYKSSDYTIHDSSFYVVDSGDFSDTGDDGGDD